MNAEQIAAVNALIKDISLSGFALIALAILYRDAKTERIMWLGLFTKILSDQMRVIESQSLMIEELNITSMSRPPPIDLRYERDKEREKKDAA